MQGRCPGLECGFEASVKMVLGHQRSCASFAALYRDDPDAALADPATVYQAAHPPTVSSPPVSRTEPSPSRRRASRSAPAAPSRLAGPVLVEYWAWQPTLLEALQDDT